MAKELKKAKKKAKQPTKDKPIKEVLKTLEDTSKKKKLRLRNQVFLAEKVEKYLDKKCKKLGLVYGENTTIAGKPKRTLLLAEAIEYLVLTDIAQAKEGKVGTFSKVLNKIYAPQEG